MSGAYYSGKPRLRRKTTIRAGGPVGRRAGDPVWNLGDCCFSQPGSTAPIVWIHRFWPGLRPAVSQDSDATNASSKRRSECAARCTQTAKGRVRLGSLSSPHLPSASPARRSFPGTSAAFKFLGAPFRVPAQSCPGWRCTTGPLRAGHSSSWRALLESESGAGRRCRCQSRRPRRVCRTARCCGAVTARQAADCYGLTAPGGTWQTQLRRTGQ